MGREGHKRVLEALYLQACAPRLYAVLEGLVNKKYTRHKLKRENRVVNAISQHDTRIRIIDTTCLNWIPDPVRNLELDSGDCFGYTQILNKFIELGHLCSLILFHSSSFSPR